MRHAYSLIIACASSFLHVKFSQLVSTAKLLTTKFTRSKVVLWQCCRTRHTQFSPHLAQTFLNIKEWSMSSTAGSCTECCDCCSSFTYKFSRNADKSQTVFSGGRSRIVYLTHITRRSKHTVSSLKLLREVVTHVPDWSARTLPTVYCRLGKFSC